jgi:gas vesicle protein
MKTRKFVDSLLSSGESSRTAAIAALIGGLAAGAALGILFAPKSGKAAREKLCDSLTALFGDKTEEETAAPEHHASHQHHTKRPKSDIREIIQHAHGGSEHTEQSLG